MYVALSFEAASADSHARDRDAVQALGDRT